jgi:hypothetical protein
MRPGRTSRQSQRDYAALFCLLTPLIARLIFDVRQKGMTPLALLFITGTILGIVALLKLLPLMWRFTEEGRRVGFDFYSFRGSKWFFRPVLLPATMEPLGRKIRLYAVFLLWPSALLFLAALLSSI